MQTLATSHNMLGLKMRIQRLISCSLVFVWIRGARAPAQHCWMCCANIVGPRFDDRETIEMLALVGSEV